MAFVEPRVVATHFHLRPGDRIADLGAGSGEFTKALARLVGPSGKVIAVEIQRQLALKVAADIRKDHLSQVEVVWGDLEAQNGTKIPADSLDAALFANVVSMLENKPEAVRECARIVRKGGKALVVDWSDSFGGLGPSSTAIMTDSMMKDLFSQNGFEFEVAFPAGDHHYGLSFRKK